MFLFIRILFRNVIIHSQCVFVFGLIAILFQVSQHMMNSMLKIKRLSLYQGNALIYMTSGHRVLFHML